MASKNANINYDTLLQISREMDDYGKRTGNSMWRAYAGNFLGKYYALTDHLLEARTAYKQSLSFVTDEKDFIVVSIHLGLGRAYSDLLMADSCFYHLNRAKDIGLRYGHKPEVGHVYTALGTCSVLLGGHYIEALDYFELAQKFKRPKRRHRDLIEMGKIYQKLGLMRESAACLQEGINIGSFDESPGELINIYAAMIDLRPPLLEIEQILDNCNKLKNTGNVSNQFFKLYIAAAKVYLDSLQLDKAYFCLQATGGLESDKRTRLEKYADLHCQLARWNYLKKQYRSSLNICLLLQPQLEHYRNWDLLKVTYDLMSKNYEVLGQPVKALHFERKREEIERLLDDRQLVNAALSTYIQRITENEKKALQQARDNAETLTLETKSNARLVFGFFTLLSLFLGATGFIFYRSFQQKKRAAAQLEAANQALDTERSSLRRTNQKLSRFSGVISHDILSNLDLILSTGNVLVGAQPRPERLAQYYDLTQRTSQQLKAYCINLLEEARHTLARPDTMPLHDPMPILRAVLERFGPALKAVKFQLDIQALSPTLLPTAVAEQIFQNLLSNALRYAATATTPLLNIREEKSSEGEMKQWVIEDNGPGMSAQQMASLWQGDSERTPEGKGQGIGLTLIRATLQEYGADIRVETGAQGGARFVVTIPQQVHTIEEVLESGV